MSGGTTLFSQTATLDAAGQRTLLADSWGSTAYSYDAAGNQTGSAGPSGAVANTFNDLRQLTHVSGPATNLSLVYDGQGDRLRSYEQAGPVWQMRNEAQDLVGGLSSLVSDGQQDYTYLAPGAGQAPLAGYSPGTSRSTYLATDPTNAVIGAGGYDAWGSARPYAGSSGPTLLAGLQGTSPFGYAGQQFDVGPGTYAMRARQYDPSTGRFQSEDPLAPDQQVPVTTNPYEYAGDMPTSVTDPSGMGWVQQPANSPDYNDDSTIIGDLLGHTRAVQTLQFDVPVHVKATCQQPVRIYNASILGLYPGGGGTLWDIEHAQAYVQAPGAQAIRSGIRTHLLDQLWPAGTVSQQA